MTYEQYRPVTERETRSWKAVEGPKTMRERRKDMVVVTRMALIGREVRGSTWIDVRLVSTSLRAIFGRDRSRFSGVVSRVADNASPVVHGL